MANVVLRAEICERLLDADRNELAQELAELKSTVKRTLVDVRRIIFDLRPMTLDDLGLAPHCVVSWRLLKKSQVLERT